MHIQRSSLVLLLFAIVDVLCAPPPMLTRRTPFGADPDSYPLAEPEPKDFDYVYPPIPAPMSKNKDIPNCQVTYNQDRRGHSATGVLCRPFTPRAGSSNLRFAPGQLIKKYESTVLTKSGSTFMPTLRIAWEIQALQKSGLLEGWSYTSLQQSGSKSDTAHGTAKMLIHLKNVSGLPLRELLRRPELMPRAMNYKTLRPAERIQLLERFKSSLAAAMEAYSQDKDLSLYNPGLNLGNVYFFFNGHEIVTQLPEWGWTQHLPVGQHPYNGSPWMIARRVRAHDDPNSPIPMEVQRIFIKVTALAKSDASGGLDSTERW